MADLIFCIAFTVVVLTWGVLYAIKDSAINAVKRLGCEYPTKGNKYYWETVIGNRFEGKFVEMDNGTAIMRLDSGDIKAVQYR